jgi:hypothetical protein
MTEIDKPVPVSLILEAFDNLLINYPYHPVLWTLYALNRRLAIRKPNLGGKSVEILDYRVVAEPWLSGVSNAVRDILAIDDKIKDCWYAYATIREAGETVFYWIPREWVKRITVNKRGNFVLLPFEFCCRQVLKRTDCKLVRCQSHFIPPRYFVDQHYFHIGCGPCHKEISHVIAEFPMFVGIKQLATMLEKAKYPELIVALLISDDELSFRMQKVKKKEDDSSYGSIKPSYICKILKHILVCKICNVNLGKFISVLDRFIGTPAIPTPLNDVDDRVSCEFYHNDKIPCNKYVIDGEFDEMRCNAFDAIKIDDSCVDDNRHEVVNTFIETYFA